MLAQLISALVESKNEAADDVLLEALRLGSLEEKQVVLSGLIRRKSVRGLIGVVELYDSLPEPRQIDVLSNIRAFHSALRECGRSDKTTLRMAAMKLVALGRQGKLAYVLSENLHSSDEKLSKAAAEALVALARWVATETRNLHKGEESGVGDQGPEKNYSPLHPRPHTRDLYNELIEQRPEIEQSVARALDVHRGKHGPELLRATLLLCDWPRSKTMSILHTAKHGGQSPMVRRLQQPPDSEHVEAFLLGASHGQLRSHFGSVFSHVNEAPVLDALLRKTHWLKDNQLQFCMHQVNRGVWWADADLLHDIERRPAEDAARIGEWLAVSGTHDVVQDERMELLRQHARDDFDARLRLFRIAARRKRGSSVQLIGSFLTDPDERLVRMAAREIVRRRPAEFENLLLQLMTNAPDSVRRVISRSIGQVGFENFWLRFDRLDRATRKAAGRAMLKILPDARTRLSRRLLSGTLQQRVKAMQMAQELELVDALKDTFMRLCTDSNPRLRSKAVAALGEIKSDVTPDVLLERVLNDRDARVRANAIEVLEAAHKTQYVPLLAERARNSHNRERANAIKAMHRMKVGTASGQLLNMLRDSRSEHRISAMWALKQIGWWQLLNEVGQIAKSDQNLRARRYALAVLRSVAEVLEAEKAAVG
ncbi:MAG: HEAT repeat domain-containing protein [Opitutaceae bacterium]|nr:HEAT repeat domain-containing protein [Opitutaceae bacterium]